MNHSGCGIDKNSLMGMQGVDVSKLETGTKLKVETYNSTYLIEILDFGKVFLSGGKTQSGIRYPNPTQCTIVGCCSYRNGALKLDWIKRDKCLLLDMDEGKNLQTSPIQELTITAPNDNWEYCFDWRRITD